MPLLPMVGLHQSIASRRADSGVASHLIENSLYVESAHRGLRRSIRSRTVRISQGSPSWTTVIEPTQWEPGRGSHPSSRASPRGCDAYMKGQAFEIFHNSASLHNPGICPYRSSHRPCTRTSGSDNDRRTSDHISEFHSHRNASDRIARYEDGGDGRSQAH
jgi:hypothetical protein